MKTRLGITFWLRTDKPNKQGQVPLSCRLTVRGRKADLSTGIRLIPREWNSARRKVLGTSEEVRRHNSYLLQMQNELENLAADLDRQGKVVTAQNLARLYRKPPVTGQTLLQLYEAFLTERAGLVGVEIRHSTTKANKTCYGRLQEFLQETHQTALLPEEVTHSVADKLLYWCLQQRGFKRSTANKQVRRLSQVLRWAVRRDSLGKNPLNLYVCREAAAAPIKYLTVGELAQLTCLELADSGLAIARDGFVFQCWTGLAYADLVTLDMGRAELHADKNGQVRRVLRGNRAKSTLTHGFEYVVPLLPEAERVLALHGDKLPVFSNQAYNRLLKELGRLAGIEEGKMTTHVGRKTAGTLLLNRGIPLPVVSKFLGHANTLITQRLYAELLDTTVVDAFALLEDSLTPSPVQGVVRPLLPTPAKLPTRPARRIAA